MDLDFWQEAVEGGAHGRELGVVPTRPFDGKHLDVHLMSGPHLGNQDVVFHRARVGRRLSPVCKTEHPDVVRFLACT